jgi:glycosyltransferase involved in cell wall biosynthesis
MNVGIFVAGIGVPPGRESNVSGHVQLPMRSCDALLERGHQPHLITNTFDADYVLPDVVRARGQAPLHFVPDGRRRGRVGMQNQKAGYRPLAMLRQLQMMKRLARELELDVLHLFGVVRTAGLGGVLKAVGVKTPVAVTIYQPLHSKLWTGMYRRVDALVASTEFVAHQSRRLGLVVELIRPGIVRDLHEELGAAAVGPRRRVLFLREATHEAGGDQVLEAFDRLAPQHPDYSFDLAVRANRHEAPGVDELAARHANVNVYRYPYPAGVSLASLMAEAVCAPLPFRRLTTHPQLAVAESLLAGVATIASDIGSNNELVRHGATGLLIPPDDAGALAAAIERLLADRERTLAMGRAARQDVMERWNWRRYGDSLVELYERLTDARGDAA